MKYFTFVFFGLPLHSKYPVYYLIHSLCTNAIKIHFTPKAKKNDGNNFL